MLLKYQTGQRPVAVNHSQLPIMASQTVDHIDMPLPPNFTGKYSTSVTCMVQMQAIYHKWCQWDANS